MTPGAQQIMKEAREGWAIDHTELSPDGPLIFLKDAPFPMKTIPTPDAIFAINTCKKQIIETLRILSSWQLLPAIVLLPFWRSFARKWLDSITRIGHGILAPYLDYVHLQGGPYALSPASQELRLFIENFLNHLGLGGNMAWKVNQKREHTRSWFFATIVAHICEYDSAYRWRLQDLISSSSFLALMDSPSKELWRLASLVQDREVHPNTARKVSRALKAASLAFWLPSVRRAWRGTLLKTDLSRLRLDEPDLYWFSLREDYNCQGRTYDDRIACLKERGWAVPVPEKVVV